MPDSDVKYCIALVRWSGRDAWSPLAPDGRIVVFDTRLMAKDFLPMLGGGRDYNWSEDGETITFNPILPDYLNQAIIGTDYDPFDAPVGIIRNCSKYGIRSEAKGRSWKHHVMWHELNNAMQKSSEQKYGDYLNKYLDEHPEAEYA